MSHRNKLTDLVQSIKTGKGHQWITAIILILNNGKFHGVYRAGYSGILGIFMALNVLCKQYNITQGEVTLGCDGILVLQSIIVFFWNRSSS